MKIENGYRIVIDTNIWITFLIGKNYLKLQSLINNYNLTLLYSDELVSEIEVVVKREKFRKYFSEKELEKIHLIFSTIGQRINVKSEVSICRDSKDNFILALCKDGNADLLFTNDLDLLVLKTFYSTSIFSYEKLFQP